uniref:Uncharacterized protein n=1 Tax=Aureoumbra lagunensis TaxID=44058 RepID=A0A7S3NK12_9STRA|mmetsp:Transcript_14524/g.19392  ORF Transcript_14524/g.19392 Transcript_14524/m.19392 type:complete len:304 (+) Transcript_14524:43-954(+)
MRVVLINTRSYWRKIGCGEDEIDLKEKLSSMSFVGFLLFFSIALGSANYFEAANFVQVFCMRRMFGALINAILMVCAFLVDVYGQPPPIPNSDIFHVTKIIGPFSFFTKQAITIQTTHSLLSFLAEASLGTKWPLFALLEAVHETATPVAVIGISLTLLFLRLNWFESNWRKEALYPWLRRGVPLGTIALVGHLLSFPVAFFDVLFVKRPITMTQLTNRNVATILLIDARRSAFFLFLYNYFFVGFTLLNAKFNGGYFPYPFMRAFDTSKKWFLFSLVILIFTTLFVMPIVLVIKFLSTRMSQ